MIINISNTDLNWVNILNCQHYQIENVNLIVCFIYIEQKIIILFVCLGWCLVGQKKSSEQTNNLLWGLSDDGNNDYDDDDYYGDNVSGQVRWDQKIKVEQLLFHSFIMNHI